MRTPCTQGIPLHHQLMRDPTVQFSRNRPHHGSMRHLTPNSTQGDPVSRRADPPSPDRQLSKAIRLTHTPSHANQWEPTGSQAATQTDNYGPAVMSQLMSIGWSFSVDSVAGATAAIHGGALSTWAPLPRPTSRQSLNFSSSAFIAVRPSSNFE